MQAVRCREWGPPDVLRLETVARRELAPCEVRIRVHAAGVNFADSLMVGGTYQVKPPFPFTPGLEAAGEVVEVGRAVDGVRIGQRVLAVLRNGGGYAEEILVNAAAVVSIPGPMDFVTAAAFPVAYGTSVGWPELGLRDAGMAPTAPSNLYHFVGYPGVAFTVGPPRR